MAAVDNQEQPIKQIYPGPIFVQPWWLNAVAPERWHDIAIEKGGQLVARMPYVITEKKGFTSLSMPKLTQTLGPWLAPHKAKYAKKLSQEHQLLAELINNLPPFDHFKQNFHHSITNWLPFYWQGFQQTTRYTYIIPDLSDPEALWSETRANIRTDIRKAQKQLAIRTDLDLEIFLDLNEMTFKRQGLELPYSRDLVRRIDRGCQTHNCRKIFFAEDHDGHLHASVYIVWDNQTAYYLMSGSDPERRNSGATSLLLWEAIKFAATKVPSFDFEGSVIQPIERFFRAFGAQQVPYFQITKTNSLRHKIRQDVRTWSRLFRDQHQK
ncbi:MAG TPA: GNAT family N-acetyltransferase [Chloroflexi bacterium]|nr:GNAT family N-acetyltransferase [Chloroflexota bacterium]